SQPHRVKTESAVDRNRTEGATPFACPNCASEHTQKLSIVYQSGTTTINLASATIEIALAGNGPVPAIGSGSMTGTQLSKLAKLVSSAVTVAAALVASDLSRKATGCDRLRPNATADTGKWKSEPNLESAAQARKTARDRPLSPRQLAAVVMLVSGQGVCAA